jgi:hypothetical protein
MLGWLQIACDIEANEGALLLLLLLLVASSVCCLWCSLSSVVVDTRTASARQLLLCY